ncbi:MAG: damage-control phosphatase ARMT1 family protein [Cyanobacteria bacterium P01_F01_bin.150]
MKQPPEICASDDSSFAAYTLRNRLPHILRQIIEDSDYATGVVYQLESLNTEVLEGTITPLVETGDRTSAIWSQCLQPHLDKSWFDAPFFFAEMYFYRRIIDIVGYRNSANPESCDPFLAKKRKGFADAQSRTQQLAEWLATLSEKDNTMEALQELLLANLWSNCADLSQLPETFRPGPQGGLESAGTAPSPALPLIRGESKTDPSTSSRNVAQGGSRLLIDYAAEVATYCHTSQPLQRVDIILDNTGIELISDLALADFLLRTGLAQRVILHAKDYPVFVSDATLHDIQFTIQQLMASDITAVAQWGQRLSEWMAGQGLLVQHHSFWTLPLYFDVMVADLQADMNASDLWIVKGDANYRRLVGDRHWPLDTPIDSITQYLTVPCLALRVLKCELLVGMDMATLESLELENDWMTNGTYGVVQFMQ